MKTIRIQMLGSYRFRTFDGLARQIARELRIPATQVGIRENGDEHDGRGRTAARYMISTPSRDYLGLIER